MSIVSISGRNAAPQPEQEPSPRPAAPPFGTRVEKSSNQPRTATIIADEIDAIDGEAKTIAGRLVRLAAMRAERENELFAVCKARQDQANRIFNEADRVLRHYFGERIGDDIPNEAESTNSAPPTEPQAAAS